MSATLPVWRGQAHYQHLPIRIIYRPEWNEVRQSPLSGGRRFAAPASHFYPT
jgi:hypothetical protein